MTHFMLKTALATLVLALPAGGALAQPGHHGPQARHAPSKAMKYREFSASRGNKWRKGQRLSAKQRRYVVSDWNRRGLRAPPRGYQWVRENNNSGDFLLVAAATGLIASILGQ